ncbi:MAG: hypothetical protein ACKO23_01905, partial [Gemmataceae bacterium]
LGNKRPGVSLLAVLTAIFIMGVGMLALLTLFPLGALSMARAIKDDRAAVIAANAAAVATAFDLRNDPKVVEAFTGRQPASPSLPSVPVLVDPQYSLTVKNLGENLPQSPGIPRVPASFAGSLTPEEIARWFTFQDEIEFDTLGGAKGAPAVNRPGTYTIAYLIRRPRFASPELTDLSVIVYSLRATESPSPERTIVANMAGTGSSLTFNYQNNLPAPAIPRPDIRKGTWIIDTSSDNSTQVMNGHIYRVENVTDSGPGEYTLELDRPLKAIPKQITILEKAIAVIERGTSWKP